MNHKNCETAKIISIAFLGWCIQSYVEAYLDPFLIGMFVVAVYCTNIDSSFNYDNKPKRIQFKIAKR